MTLKKFLECFSENVISQQQLTWAVWLILQMKARLTDEVSFEIWVWEIGDMVIPINNPQGPRNGEFNGFIWTNEFLENFESNLLLFIEGRVQVRTPNIFRCSGALNPSIEIHCESPEQHNKRLMSIIVNKINLLAKIIQRRKCYGSILYKKMSPST